MKISLWRAALWTVWAFALVSVGYAAWGVHNTLGTSGIANVLATAGRPYLQTIEVTPHSPASRAGLRTGDVIDVRPMSGADRYQLYNYKYRGNVMRVYALRGRRLSQFALTADASADGWDWFMRFGMAGLVWMILFAGLLAWRRPDSPDARILSLLLMLIVLASTLHPVDSRLRWPALDSAKNVLHFLLLFDQVLLCVYMMRFARPASRLRKILFVLACASSAASVLSGWVAIAGAWSGVLALETAQFGGIESACRATLDACALLYGIATAVQCRDAERTRFLWAFVPLAVLIAAGLSQNAAMSVPNPNLAWLYASHVAVNVAFFLAPLGLTYSLFNRRLLDIGFVLNRAAVFSAVSVVLIGTFVLVEWALGEWASGVNHAANIAVSGALALALGLSVRFVHAKAEHFVDNLLFRKRREDEEAIRRMAREAPYITDRATLLARAERVLLQHADASSASILLDDGNGCYGGIEENDPALVSLRAEHARVDLHAMQSAIDGEWAYPMISRGRLIGALVLGAKRSLESYAPDEAAAIAQLAHGVADAIDALARNAPDDGALSRMERRLDAVSEALLQLPSAIARELRATPAE